MVENQKNNSKDYVAKKLINQKKNSIDIPLIRDNYYQKLIKRSLNSNIAGPEVPYIRKNPSNIHPLGESLQKSKINQVENANINQISDTIGNAKGNLISNKYAKVGNILGNSMINDLGNETGILINYKSSNENNYNTNNSLSYISGDYLSNQIENSIVNKTNCNTSSQMENQNQIGNYIGNKLEDNSIMTLPNLPNLPNSVNFESKQIQNLSCLPNLNLVKDNENNGTELSLIAETKVRENLSKFQLINPNLNVKSSPLNQRKIENIRNVCKAYHYGLNSMKNLDSSMHYKNKNLNPNQNKIKVNESKMLPSNNYENCIERRKERLSKLTNLKIRENNKDKIASNPLHYPLSSNKICRNRSNKIIYEGSSLNQSRMNDSKEKSHYNSFASNLAKRPERKNMHTNSIQRQNKIYHSIEAADSKLLTEGNFYANSKKVLKPNPISTENKLNRFDKLHRLAKLAKLANPENQEKNFKSNKKLPLSTITRAKREERFEKLNHTQDQFKFNKNCFSKKLHSGLESTKTRVSKYCDNRRRNNSELNQKSVYSYSTRRISDSASTNLIRFKSNVNERMPNPSGKNGKVMQKRKISQNEKNHNDLKDLSKSKNVVDLQTLNNLKNSKELKELKDLKELKERLREIKNAKNPTIKDPTKEKYFKIVKQLMNNTNQKETEDKPFYCMPLKEKYQRVFKVRAERPRRERQINHSIPKAYKEKSVNNSININKSQNNDAKKYSTHNIPENKPNFSVNIDNTINTMQSPKKVRANCSKIDYDNKSKSLKKPRNKKESEIRCAKKADSIEGRIYLTEIKKLNKYSISNRKKIRVTKLGILRAVSWMICLFKSRIKNILFKKLRGIPSSLIENEINSFYIPFKIKNSDLFDCVMNSCDKLLGKNLIPWIKTKIIISEVGSTFVNLSSNLIKSITGANYKLLNNVNFEDGFSKYILLFGYLLYIKLIVNTYLVEVPDIMYFNIEKIK